MTSRSACSPIPDSALDDPHSLAIWLEQQHFCRVSVERGAEGSSVRFCVMRGGGAWAFELRISPDESGRACARLSALGGPPVCSVHEQDDGYLRWKHTMSENAKQLKPTPAE